MKKFYFGAWNNFYNLAWPIRFFIELAVSVFVVFLIIKIIKKIVHISILKVFGIKVWVWLVTEAVYLVGRKKEWAVEVDRKVTEWGHNALNTTNNINTVSGLNSVNKKKKSLLKKPVIIGVVILYFAAILADMPILKNLQESYFVELVKIKNFFQGYEKMLSKGYEDYPPLFIKKESVEGDVDMNNQESAEEVVEEAPIYIQLNEKGIGGANIRREPSLDGEIVESVNGESIILYQKEWTNDGERYWFKVFLQNYGKEGWLSGYLVDEEQLKTLIY